LSEFNGNDNWNKYVLSIHDNMNQY